MQIKVYHNQDRWAEDIILKEVFKFFDEPPVMEIKSILEWVFEEFNVGESDLARKYYQAAQRSLSVGDVVVVGETAWYCASVGWDSFPTDVLVKALERV